MVEVWKKNDELVMVFILVLVKQLLVLQQSMNNLWWNGAMAHGPLSEPNNDATMERWEDDDDDALGR